MATEITKEKLFNDLNELKDALEFPYLYFILFIILFIEFILENIMN